MGMYSRGSSEEELSGHDHHGPSQQPAGQSVTARSVSWAEETLNNVKGAGLLG